MTKSTQRRFSCTRSFVPTLFLCVLLASSALSSQAHAGKTTWQDALLAARAELKASKDKGKALGGIQGRMWRDYPIQSDWMLQDRAGDYGKWLAGDAETQVKSIAKVLDELGTDGGKLRARLEALSKAKTSPTNRKWLDLYIDACEMRRSKRLQPLLSRYRKIVFTKHYDMGGSHYAYTEGQSDAQSERHFRAGTALCVLEMDGIYGKVHTLINDPKGVIRDPDVSFDGKRVLFAWKKSDRGDDYHLYEMDVGQAFSLPINQQPGKAAPQIRQLTSGRGFADYEPAYMPNGDIVFNSTRCVQIVDCWWTEVSNLYTCDKDGRHMRRLSFDQVHTNYPTLMEDGRVIYTRWDYSDRGQIYPQGLFKMNPDGTSQTELYGNNSWFPTTIMHSRGIPGTQKVIAVLSGHHTRQRGKLAIIDPAKGRQENTGVQLIAPVRETKAVHIDAYGQGGEQFQYPYPLTETDFIVTYSPSTGGRRRFAIFAMDIDGRRELLASDPRISCNQPVPLAPRKTPPERPSMVNYREATGTYYMQNIYVGPGLKGIPRGTIKRLRVIELSFRAAGVGSNGNSGPAGGALVSTPVSINNGSWDVKIVHGDAKVYEDGSASFIAPARKPLYFQALDAKGHMVQTMRSWSTLQPGEYASCVGCHEHKNSAPSVSEPMMAMKAGPQKLKPFYGPPRGFSFVKEVQPILDRHCIKCHNGGKRAAGEGVTIDLKKAQVISPLEAKWQYTTQPPPAGWKKPGFDSSKWKTGRAGFGTKGTPGGKIHALWNTSDIWMRRTITIPKALKDRKLVVLFCHDEDVDVYINGTQAICAKGYITQFKTERISRKIANTLKAGKNVIAVHCRQTGGGQFIDVAIYDTAPLKKPETAVAKAKMKKAFSLLGRQNVDGRAKRRWSDSYLALTKRGRINKLVNWVSAQSTPSMIPPYHAGAARSGLIKMLEKGHNDVKLSQEEMDKIACWIDLLIPYCGDYYEANAWNSGEMRKYNRYQAKRDRMEALERKNIESFLKATEGS